MTFPGRFVEQLIAEKIDRISLSFLVDALEIRRGGVAANISFGLGMLGLRPLLVGGGGPGFGPYPDWLRGDGGGCSGGPGSTPPPPARFLCPTHPARNPVPPVSPAAVSARC